MNDNNEWDHLVSPDDFICYGNCSDCPNLIICSDGQYCMDWEKRLELSNEGGGE